MKYITYLNLTRRLIFLSLIFIFIKSKSDYLLVPLINGIGAIVAGLLSVLLLRKEQIKIKAQSANTLIWYFKNSYVMALAYASNSFKANINIIIVKFLFSFSEVAFYDLALKISNIGHYLHSEKNSDYVSPTLVIIGEVVKLHPRFKWFDGAIGQAEFFAPVKENLSEKIPNAHAAFQ